MGKREEIRHTKQGGANVNDNIGRSSLLPSRNDSHDIVYQLFRSMTACVWKLSPVGGEQNRAKRQRMLDLHLLVGQLNKSN